jgi:hypothetical protein
MAKTKLDDIDLKIVRLARVASSSRTLKKSSPSLRGVLPKGSGKSPTHVNEP